MTSTTFRPRLSGALLLGFFCSQACVFSSAEETSTIDGSDGSPDASSAGASGDGDSADDDDASLRDEPSRPPVLGGQVGYGGAASGDGDAEADAPCLKILSLGSVAQLGAVPGEAGMDAVVDFLNEQSSAEAVYVQEQPELTSDFLASYDLVLLQNLGKWEWTMPELDVFQDWVESGGGVMALSGYHGDVTDSFPTNELLSFTGLNYAASETATTVADCGYCLGTTHKQAGWNPEHPIARGLKYVGAFQGRAIHGDGEIVASEKGLNLGVTKEVGEGRVFLFHDDWVTYTSQWAGESLVSCESNPSCSGVTVGSTYQMAQFWFNSLSWLSKDRSCFEMNGL